MPDRVARAVLTRSAAALAVLALAAGCYGPSAPRAARTPAGTAGANGPVTVSVRRVDGIGAVVTDRNGAVLYTADAERAGRIACAAECARVWLPLTVPVGAALTADPAVTATLGTVIRPDGGRQVTLDGHPLYRLAGAKPGTAPPEGVTDSYRGVRLVWRVATVALPPPTRPEAVGPQLDNP
jgi:predicted lipoprotein with Yx(FWY)xxD motif